MNFLVIMITSHGEEYKRSAGSSCWRKRTLAPAGGFFHTRAPYSILQGCLYFVVYVLFYNLSANKYPKTNAYGFPQQNLARTPTQCRGLTYYTRYYLW